MKQAETDIKEAQTPEELAEVQRIRRQVFVHEQQMPDIMEKDRHDDFAIQLLAYDEDRPVGTLRLRWLDPKTAKIERVAVLPELRGTGIGRSMLESVEAYAKRKGAEHLVLSAQLHARPFYEKLGYHTEGKPYEEMGVKHIWMNKKLA
ncbi:GNAT family N-acetyltransferase [Polycladomyces sp. WAk]|uniref:GNAT family N-acetyltransferase n=1 Tax=Polycladomyces zharkentensis TaxID=2807616 RepID=A0ABS2WG78_9BACL|nr:GNAT family N-acetyltransferase [Polycladomyces sp. WAk]MBN2908429.1 GNAT family N-acetyltransferase [Polycladomyces sp. WAk]